MTKDDVQSLKNILSLFDQASFKDTSLKQQLSNARILNDFSVVVKKLEDSLQLKDVKKENKLTSPKAK